MSSQARRRYIDWTRGVAVLVMIEAHTVDAWVRLGERSTPAYRNLIVLGGFAAPLFLWLAGLTTVLGAERAFKRTGDRRSVCIQACRRGLFIFFLAFLFRVQAFVLSPGSALASLLRVDILNVMGPSIALTALAWALCRRQSARMLVLASAALAVAMVTPLVRAAGWVTTLPALLQWYIRPAGDHTVFTLFPWSGFVFAGGALGTLLAPITDRRSEGRLHLATLAAGIGLVALGFYTASMPSLYRDSSFWTSSPTFFAIRVGILMMMLAAACWLEVPLEQWNVGLAPLERLGRSSLFVYWIHMELVYGYVSWPIRRHLSIYQLPFADGFFCLLLYAAIGLRDRIVGRWRLRQSLGPAAEVASI